MSIEQLEQALLDADAELRRRAVLHGLNLPASPALAQLLMRALGDYDWRVRKEAGHVVLARVGDLPLIEPLVLALCQSENVGLRNAALDVLEELGERAAPALIAALPTAPEHARKFVVEALGEAGGPLVLGELKSAAQSSDVNLAGEAIEALARIGGPEAEGVIRATLSSREPFLRLAALEALNRSDVTLEWEALEPLLNDRMLRRGALAALGRCGRGEALDPLFEALEDPVLPTTGAAAVALVRLMRDHGALGERAKERFSTLSSRARASLSALLGSAQEIEPRRAAAELLARARDEKALGQIVVQLTLDAVSPATLQAMREWGAGAVRPLLALSVTLEAPEERAVALELAADLATVEERRTAQLDELVRKSLHASLRDHEPVVVAAAARSLAPYVEPGDAGPLLQCALSADPDVARAAVRALEALVIDAREAVESALREVEIESTQAAALASVLGMVRGPDSIDRLRALLSSDEGHVRRAALQALGRIGGASAAALVALALADEDSEVQVAAAQVLGRLRDDDGGVPGASELMLAVQSEHAHVRAAVARALGNTGLPRATEPLCELLHDSDSSVAIAAVEGLGQLAGESLGCCIADALAHPDVEVVKAALRALATTRDEAAPRQLLAALSHGAWDVRQLAAELIGELRLDEGQPALAAQLAHETDDLVRGALLGALHVLGEGGR